MSKGKTAADKHEAMLERQDDSALVKIVRACQYQPTIKVGLDELLGPDELKQGAIPDPICHSERSEES